MRRWTLNGYMALIRSTSLTRSFGVGSQIDSETLRRDPSALIAELSTTGTIDVCTQLNPSGSDHLNAVISHPLVQEIHQVNQPRLVPASTAVPTAAAKQQNEKYNDE